MLFPSTALVATTLLLSNLVFAFPTGRPSDALEAEPAVGRRALTAKQRAAAAKVKAASLAKVKAASSAKVKAASVKAASIAAASASSSKSKSLSLSKSKSMSLSKSKALAAKKTTTPPRSVTSKATTTSTTTSKPTTTTTTTTKSTTVKTTTTTTKTSAAPAIKTLAAGDTFRSGSISSTFRWQSSGILTSGCPQGVNGLAISSCYHAHLADTGMLQSGSAAKRAWDAEEDAAMYDEHTDAYFEAFPEQLEAIHADVAAQSGGEGLELYKRQVIGCGSSSTPSNSTNNGTTTPTPPVLRQRIEMFSWPGVPAGQTWTYNWRSYQVAGVNTTGQFFHSWQLLRRDACTGPVIGSNLFTGADGASHFGVADYITSRRCNGTGNCPSVPLSTIFGKTLQHSLTVKYGLGGTFSYSTVDVANPGTPIMSYSATGDMGASGSVKFGEYRRVVAGISAADSYVGDYSAQRLA